MGFYATKYVFLRFYEKGPNLPYLVCMGNRQKDSRQKQTQCTYVSVHISIVFIILTDKKKTLIIIPIENDYR